MDNTNKTQANKKRKNGKKKNSGKVLTVKQKKNQIISHLIVMESAEEIPLSKLSLFKTEKILSKNLESKTVLKKT